MPVVRHESAHSRNLTILAPVGGGNAMEEPRGPSFTRLVLRKAWENLKSTLKHRILDAVLAVGSLSLAVGFSSGYLVGLR